MDTDIPTVSSVEGSGRNHRSVAEFLTYAVLVYWLVGVFYNIGFFLSVDRNFSFAGAFVSMENFLTLPIVPITKVAIYYFGSNPFGVFLYIFGISVWVVIRGFLSDRDEVTGTPSAKRVFQLPAGIRMLAALASIALGPVHK